MYFPLPLLSHEVLVKLSLGKSISFTNMRVELEKIETQYEKLRAKKADVESKFPSTGDMELATNFAAVLGKGIGSCN